MSAFARILPRVSLPPSTLLMGVLALAYVLPGLVGHDPWKPEDAIGIGIVQQMLAHGEWLLPHLAGEVYVEDGPFYYWISALLARLASFALPVHDGVRLANVVAVIASLYFLRAAARELYGRASADGAMLVLLGSLGLLIHAHEALGELGMLAGQALAWLGLAMAPRKPHKGGMALGFGLAIAFLSKGLLAVIAPACAALLLFASSRHWRSRVFALAGAEALAAAIISLALWWTLVALRADAAGAVWLDAQWKVFAFPSGAKILYDIELLSWAAWPAWPIALWFLWDRRRSPADPGVVLAGTALAVSLLLLFAQREQREVHALALLLPLALLAGGGVEHLRRGAANSLAWFGAMTFSFFGLLVWLGWVAMISGSPQQIARNFAKLEPGHVQQFEWLPFALAVLLSLAWILVLFRCERSRYRSVFYWACGTTVLWGLVMTLWLSWIDYGKTYRPVALALKRALPAGVRCIESRGLGESQRAALDYHAGIVTRRVEVEGANRCPVLLVQAQPGDDDRALSAGWKRIWEGSRPRDRERYRLYARINR
jgi:4-amino-4-deoxy-L-arabinose transferase-like glycosyltransferase